ncbi:Protein FAM228B [Hondaea fermentalgiana]|uniref:Protein FAM228B n=1 Tax=Hondaea fermentalgiana TaxID=2315210 RepID=A0A2R5G6J6_9STRA|nr:Protein FAM228B [Hondaea fermentalgiana]|eukprot:GBG25949.1 Protein FAM228B [Hondaea fermentalgiana]
MEQLQEQSERAVRDRLENLRVKKEAQFQKMYHEVLDTKAYTKQVDEMLDFHDQMELRKKQQRYQEWRDKVFGTIQSKVAQQLASRDPEGYRRLLRAEYEKYLQATNEKDTIFLDIVIESAYNPFTVNEGALRVNLGEIDDPTQSVIAKHKREQTMIPGGDGPVGQAGSVRAPSRGSLEVGMWASGKIESTPHGYFSKLMGNSDDGPRLGASNYESKVHMDHFGFPKDRAAVDAEFPKGKRTYPEKH